MDVPPGGALRVVTPGTCSTVQDLGRPGYRGLGVPPAGAFDRSNHTLANALVGNPETAATIEMTLLGGSFEALGPLALALAGATMRARIVRPDGSERPVPFPGAFPIAAGERLELGGTPAGVRTYLATRLGWRTEAVLGSRSSEQPLRSGDILPADSGTIDWLRPRAGAFDPAPTPGPILLRLTDGPDSDLASWDGLHLRVARSDASRMGVRLDGAGAANPGPNDPMRLSAPVAPGALQWTGGGWIVLGVACGTMGGYPHVAQVIEPDLDRLAQAAPGAEIQLVRVSHEDGLRLAALAQGHLARLACQWRCRGAASARPAS